jgi:very-short-patch-repair endonuclease
VIDGTSSLRARLVVEVGGRYHAQRSAADRRGDNKLRRLGYRLLRLPAPLVMIELAAAVERVSVALQW